MLRRFLLLNILLFLSLAVFSKPARTERIYLRQPDGSGFFARFFGDEMMRVKVTDEGAAVIQGEDGWWYYAEYDASGRKSSTGCRVGLSVSSDVLMRSCDIPYGQLAEIRTARKNMVLDAENHDSGILARIKANTRSETDAPVVKNALVILVQFKGEKERFKYTEEDFRNLLNQKGYSSYGAVGSAKEYFDDQFNGKFEFNFDVSDIVTLDKEMSFYGGNDNDGGDRNPHMMIVEACQIADTMIDFTKYDQDDDGEVDNVFVFFAGRDEAEGGSEDCIWSHSWYIKDGAGRNLILDGVRINRYACASELRLSEKDQVTMASIGTFCHEYAHTLGLPDLYDTDYQVGGLSAGTWQKISLMDAGNYNNDGNSPPNLTAVERELLYPEEAEMLEGTGRYTLESIVKGRYFRMDTDNPDEYFLLECRTSSGWDRFIGGEGMLVYHIDRSKNAAGYSEVYKRDVSAAERWMFSNEVNAFAAHQCADLIEADGRPDRFGNVYDDSYVNYLRIMKGLFYPYGNVASITPKSTPGLKCWGDAKIHKAIMDIAYDGSKVSFDVAGFSDGSMPVPREFKKDVFQDAAIITFSSSFIFSGKAKIVCEQAGEVLSVAEVGPYEKGKWAYLIEGLDYSTSYKVYVNFVEGDYVGETSELSFMTKRKQNDGYPYICLQEVTRTDDGAFPVGAKLPLRLFNAREAKEIRWTFNDSPIVAGPGCYYLVKRKGILKAHITWEDGSEEVVMKEINIGEVSDE